MPTRRAALAAFAALGLGSRARAQSYAARTISIVVPYPPGGPIDRLARLIAQEAALGQPIVVENRPGGSGIIGTNLVAHAEPDGHTLVLGTNQTHATDQSLVKDCPYDAVRDFAPVAGIAAMPHVLVTRYDLPARTVAELVGALKKQRGQEALARQGSADRAQVAGGDVGHAAGRNGEMGCRDQDGARDHRLAHVPAKACPGLDPRWPPVRR